MELNHSQRKALIKVAGGLSIIVIALWVAGLFTPHQRNILSYSTAKRNVAYCNSSNAAQTLDFYRPKRSKDKVLPIVIYVHGGGWSRGSKNDDLIMNVWGPHFIKKDMAVATIGYRMKTNQLYPDENNDIACALAYLKNNADKLNIDINKSIFFGDSAGAQLISYAALNPNGEEYQYQKPAGVIDFYGVSNFPKIVIGKNPDYNARCYLGKGYLDKAPLASPINFVDKDSPPFLIIHGTGDSVVPISQSDELYQKLMENSIPVEYIKIKDAGHGFNGPELGSKNWKIIKNAVDQFLNQTIGI